MCRASEAKHALAAIALGNGSSLSLVGHLKTVPTGAYQTNSAYTVDNATKVHSIIPL
jgi:hypothetical protein